jgi:hypothetical protein
MGRQPLIPVSIGAGLFHTTELRRQTGDSVFSGFIPQRPFPAPIAHFDDGT